MKNTGNSWDGYSKAIGDMFEKEHEANIKLSPSKPELEYIVGLASGIFKHTVLMKNASDMAHQNIIEFETAQKIIDGTRQRVKESIKYLEGYLDSRRRNR